MEMDGRPLEMNSHSDAIARGIDAVYQTLVLADHLFAAANVFLGNELTRQVAGLPTPASGAASRSPKSSGRPRGG